MRTRDLRISAIGCLTAFSIGLVPLSIAASAAQPPERALDRVLELAGKYVLDYGTKMSVVIGTERYAQWLSLSARSSKRMLVSEYVLVHAGSTWTGFRDVYDVDGHPVRDRKDRLEKLFFEKSPTAMAQARQIADESARYNIGPIVRNFNTPTMALYFLEPGVRRRFQFRRSGDDRVEDVAVWKIDFQEVGKPTAIVTPAGKDMPARGTFWIDPETGAILKSHMTTSTETHIVAADETLRLPPDRAGGRPTDWKRRTFESLASVTVTYRRDERLALLVPVEMRETYEAPWAEPGDPHQDVARINCRATYENFKRFETETRVGVPR